MIIKRFTSRGKSFIENTDDYVDAYFKHPVGALKQEISKYGRAKTTCSCCGEPVILSCEELNETDKEYLRHGYTPFNDS